MRKFEILLVWNDYLAVFYLEEGWIDKDELIFLLVLFLLSFLRGDIEDI